MASNHRLIKRDSETHRLEGNRIYATVATAAKDEIRIARLKESLVCYNLAVQYAVDFDELSSAHKNCAISELEIFKLYASRNSNYKQCQFYMEGFVSDNLLAVKNGHKCVKPLAWTTALEAKATTAVDAYLTFLGSVSFEHRVEALSRLARQELVDGELKVQLLYNVGRLYFSKSITELENQKTRASSSSIHECSFYYEECGKILREIVAARSNTNLDHLHMHRMSVDLFGEEVAQQMIVVSGTKFKEDADASLRLIMSNADKIRTGWDVIDIECAWDTIDMYRVAIAQTKCKDLELEAEALSQIGYIYEKVLHEDAKAKVYFYACLSLCESMKPKTFTKKVWFIRCEASIKRYQDAVVKEENEKLEAEKKKVMDEIKGDLEKIVKAGKDMTRKQFLTFVYKDYAPKNAEHTLSKELNNDGELKKAYKTALIHYHPDKNSVDKHGYAWFFVSEQCAKELSCIYEGLKADEESKSNLYTSS